MGELAYTNASSGKQSIVDIMSSGDYVREEIPIGYTEDKVYTQDFTKVSNMLVTGTTGSGKTAFIQTIMSELQTAFLPDDIKFVVYDSKMVDYTFLNGNPYLMIPIITEANKASAMISWLLNEATSRRQDINSLNMKPHIFAIFDDYYDVSQFTDSEDTLIRLLQISRTVKIHCILITSTPSAQVISSNLKANMPYKIAFHTATKSVSRMIIDESGAELLNIPGEMIFIGQSGRIKCNSVFCEYEELQELCNSAAVKYNTSANKLLQDTVNAFSGGSSLNPLEQYERKVTGYDYSVDGFVLDQVARMVIESEKASIGMIQRKLKVGFNRAARLMDDLYELGIVGAEEGVKPRDILVSPEVYDMVSSEIMNISSPDDFPRIKEILLKNDAGKPIARSYSRTYEGQYNKNNESGSSETKILLRPQSPIKGIGYEIGVVNNRIEVTCHFHVHGVNTTATPNFPADKIVGLIIKKSKMFSKKSYIQFIFDEDINVVTQDNRASYEKGIAQYDRAIEATIQKAMAFLHDGVLTIPYEPRDYALFHHFMMKISDDINIELKEI